MRVLVTGANGKLGRGVVADLLAHDVDVVATDALGPAGHLSDLGVPLVHADLTDLGEPRWTSWPASRRSSTSRTSRRPAWRPRRPPSRATRP